MLGAGEHFLTLSISALRPDMPPIDNRFSRGHHRSGESPPMLSDHDGTGCEQ